MSRRYLNNSMIPFNIDIQIMRTRWNGLLKITFDPVQFPSRGLIAYEVESAFNRSEAMKCRIHLQPFPRFFVFGLLDNLPNKARCIKSSMNNLEEPFPRAGKGSKILSKGRMKAQRLQDKVVAVNPESSPTYLVTHQNDHSTTSPLRIVFYLPPLSRPLR